ncbi:MAG: hypothetical protein K5894_11680 [Lachnospiraceae bacterium]|nr:hypothetical protein [Lachnospiraceae bacterium]
MKKTSALKKAALSFLTAVFIMNSALGTAVYAEEAAEDAAAAEETAAEGETEGEESAEGSEGETTSDGVTPSSIATNIDGKFLALTFPDSEVPTGFSTFTVDYSGETVELAQRVTKSATLGAEGLTVTLAYLTDADGSNGEFYLCDTTNNATMSDMIKIDGMNGHYIIVLDPGDNVVGPDGFKKKDLKWGSKAATAWSLPDEVSTEEESEDSEDSEDKDKEDSKDEEKSDEEASLFNLQTVYAADDILSAGAAADEESAGGDADAEETSDETAGEDAEAAENTLSSEEQEAAMLALEELNHTNASGLIAPTTDEFCLLYAVDDMGNLGFFLYDIEYQTYQRYVDVPHGETDTTKKYRSLSRTRLFIIIILVVIIVILAFVLINFMLGGRGAERSPETVRPAKKKKRRKSEDDEDDDDMRAIRERVVKKEKARLRGNGVGYLSERERARDYEDNRYPDNDDDEDNDDGMPIERNRAAEDVDWENMEITAGLPSKEINKKASSKSRHSERVVDDDFDDDYEPRPRKPQTKKKDYDFDEDFDFEFLDIKK